MEQSLSGFASCYAVQAQKARDRAKRTLQHLQNNDVPVVLAAVARTDADLKDDVPPENRPWPTRDMSPS